MCPFVEVTLNLNHSTYIKLLHNHVVPLAHYLTEEHIIPIPGVQDDDSHLYKAASVPDLRAEHSADRKGTRLNSSRAIPSRMPASA